MFRDIFALFCDVLVLPVSFLNIVPLCAQAQDIALVLRGKEGDERE
jgi:hypothetical protein